MRRAVGYCRVSTADQAEEGVSMDAQEAKIRAYCVVHDLDLIDIYADPGISGKRMDNRPALQSALQACDQGAVLITYSMSRVSRSTLDMLTIADRLKERGSDFVSLSESIDTTSPAGRLFFTIMAALAQFEREQTLARIQTAIEHKRAKNERLGKIPYGWQLADDDKTLEPNEAERAVLALIQRHHREGLSLRAISKALEAQGHLARHGKPFAASTIKVLLDQAASPVQEV